MKTTDTQFRVPRAQMELPLGGRLGGSLRSSSSRPARRQKASDLVADWWFNRMRMDVELEAQLPEGRVAA